MTSAERTKQAEATARGVPFPHPLSYEQIIDGALKYGWYVFPLAMHIRRAQLKFFAHLIADDGDPLLKQMLYGECFEGIKKANKTYTSLTKNWTTALTMFVLEAGVLSSGLRQLGRSG